MNEPLHPPAQPLSEVIEDCQHWLSNMLVGLFYSKSDQPAALPKAYGEWIAHPQTEEKFRPALIDQLKHSAETMAACLQETLKSVPPKQHDFQQFLQAYEDFIGRLTNVENQRLLSDKGIDADTGFKTDAVLVDELKKELERRSRRGNPFSIAMIRIDGDAQNEEKEYQLKAIADAFRKCMRSFDDIYRAGDKDFVAGLKHSDLKGAFRFTERVKEELTSINAGFTFSSCVAEPDPADDIVGFLENMKGDLAKIIASGDGQVAKFEEISPLQRYVNNIGKQ